MNKRSILFVCTGNTCRSPMAEMIARHALTARLGVDNLSETSWSVDSAGAYAAAGSPATPEAVAAVKSLGITPSPHQSTPLSGSLVEGADVIYCMTDSHRQAILSVAPQAADKVQLLDPDGDIDDPIGSGLSVYRQVASRMQKLINQRLDQLAV